MTFLGLAPTRSDLCEVKYLFTDIDDTLTTHGQLLPQTYQALWDLHAAGIAIVPVTGGSAGWCEHIVRAWPVAAVIGESGAFAVTNTANGVVFDYWENEALQIERQARHLRAITALVGDNFHVAHDQPFRLADVAIDIAGKSRGDVDALAAAIRAMGGTVAISSIHINSWIGAYDKRSMSERLLHRLFDISPEQLPLQTAFVGDSRNDAPMFGYVRNSFGVSNIVPILADLPAKPKWISAQPAGLGFVDIASALLDAKSAQPITAHQ